MEQQHTYNSKAEALPTAGAKATVKLWSQNSKDNLIDYYQLDLSNKRIQPTYKQDE